MSIKLYNSLSREKELFQPIRPPYVGMYVCGPTVYSDVHLGNCRSFLSFDLIFRYLLFSGYKVRYVRNITDVGHLVGDVDSDAEDKVSARARLEQVEPMELVQKYANGFHDMMRILNLLPPSIEPTATGHLIEQIEMVKQILENGLAYERNGSVYLSIEKLQAKYPGTYGQLSGKVLDDLFSESRALKKQDEKENPADFAIWMKADERHLMRWPSPWGVGFPGWHLECSAMSTKYLGPQFDIHGGGMDLQFPHHENEIAQNHAACGCSPVKYWMHGNMMLLNGKKMSKSDGNNITPTEMFTGNSPHVSKGYSPMTFRFLCLMTHYRSTLDLSDTALQAAEKGYQRLMEAHKWLRDSDRSHLSATAGTEDAKLLAAIENIKTAMDDDFNSSQALASLFEMVPSINAHKNKQIADSAISKDVFEKMKTAFDGYITEVLGLLDESASSSGDAQTLDGVMQLVIELRKKARENKDWSTSDAIRDSLANLELQLNDGKEGTSWGKK